MMIKKCIALLVIFILFLNVSGCKIDIQISEHEDNNNYYTSSNIVSENIASEITTSNNKPIPIEDLETVELTGTIIVCNGMIVPNIDENGEWSEIIQDYYVLCLDNPLDFNLEEVVLDGMEKSLFENVTEVHVFWAKNDLSRFIDRHVKVTGEAYAAHTIRHMRDVMFTVSDVELF